MKNLNKHQQQIFKTEKEIKLALDKLSITLNKFLESEPEIIWLTIMTGGIIFSMDLVRLIEKETTLDFLEVSSYDGALHKKNKPKITEKNLKYVEGKTVILCDDLIDSGESMQEIIKYVETFNPKQILVVALWGKKERIKTNRKEFFAFNEPAEEFVYGYGLDIEKKYRNIPYICIIKKNIKNE